MVFAHTRVCTGEARALVVAVGEQTEVAKVFCAALLPRIVLSLLCISSVRVMNILQSVHDNHQSKLLQRKIREPTAELQVELAQLRWRLSFFFACFAGAIFGLAIYHNADSQVITLIGLR
jgi:magnesium-transporting ATPase (P-type)